MTPANRSSSSTPSSRAFSLIAWIVSGADYAVADFVPNHRFEADVALDRITFVERHSLSAVITVRVLFGWTP